MHGLSARADVNVNIEVLLELSLMQINLRGFITQSRAGTFAG
jgi:hypothetical protein